MKIFLLVFTYSIFFILDSARANECVANPPAPSILAEKVDDYQKFEDHERQIVTETFKTDDIGDVMIRFESCEHLVWTVIFLSSDPFILSISQSERFENILKKLSTVPISSTSRFNDFLAKVKQWAAFSQMKEQIEPDSYLLWRRDEEMLSDILLKSRARGSGSRTEIALNISL